jgi:hypothetical protein
MPWSGMPLTGDLTELEVRFMQLTQIVRFPTIVVVANPTCTISLWSGDLAPG